MDDVTELIAKLKHSDWQVRYAAASDLRQIGSPAVPALMDALKDMDTNVRIFAAHLLSEIKDPQAVPALIIALKDADRRVRQKTARLLSKIASSEPMPELRDALPILRRLRNYDPFESSYRDALAKIEAATSGMKDLPLPAPAPLLDTSSLPRPSIVPATSPDDLPIPASSTAENAVDLQSSGLGVVARSRRKWLHRWFKREEGH